MPIFKLFFQIVKKNKLTFILSLVINIFISIMYVQNSTTQTTSNWNDTKSPIAIFNKDSGEIATYFESYLKKQLTVVNVKDNEQSKQDALYFQTVTGIVTIPKGFSEEINHDKLGKIKLKSIPNSKDEYNLESLINNYLSKIQYYQALYPDKEFSEIATLTESSLSKEPTVTLASVSNTSAKQSVVSSFHLLAYGLFSTILSGIGYVSIIINRKEIKERNQVSPISQHKQSVFYNLGIAVFSILAWGIFTGISLGTNNAKLLDPFTLLLMLNSIVFLLVIICLAGTLSFFIKDQESISGLNNMLVLGTCFISGVFVPQFLLSDFVLKLSSFFPTYWFVTNNNILAKLDTYNWDTLKDYLFNLGILLLFALAFFLINFLLRKERKQKSSLAGIV